MPRAALQMPHGATLEGEPSGKIVGGNNDHRYEAAFSTSYGLEVNSDLSLNLPVNRMS
jgi:hypothetical protein